MRLTAAILASLILASTQSYCTAQTSPTPPTPIIRNSAVKPDGGNYSEQKNALAAERKKLAAEYQKTADQTARRKILEESRRLFAASIDNRIFPFWYGTDWDFYGTTETPGAGKIACGYFVSTVLRDAGLKVNRVSLAQQASENIIKSLTTEARIKRFRNVSLQKFVAEIEKLGAGLYVVGLDFHVGFLYHDGAEVYFVHSSYVEPSETIREKAAASPVLEASKYRVVGKISADDALILRWLDQTAIPTVKR